MGVALILPCRRSVLWRRPRPGSTMRGDCPFWFDVRAHIRHRRVLGAARRSHAGVGRARAAGDPAGRRQCFGRLRIADRRRMGKLAAAAAGRATSLLSRRQRKHQRRHHRRRPRATRRAAGAVSSGDYDHRARRQRRLARRQPRRDARQSRRDDVGSAARRRRACCWSASAFPRTTARLTGSASPPPTPTSPARTRSRWCRFCSRDSPKTTPCSSPIGSIRWRAHR